MPGEKNFILHRMRGDTEVIAEENKKYLKSHMEWGITVTGMRLSDLFRTLKVKRKSAGS